jgi:hypothetical protein
MQSKGKVQYTVAKINPLQRYINQQETKVYRLQVNMTGEHNIRDFHEISFLVDGNDDGSNTITRYRKS